MHDLAMLAKETIRELTSQGMWARMVSTYSADAVQSPLTFSRLYS